MSKELFIKCLEEMVDEAMELDDTLTYEAAYTLVSASVYPRYVERLSGIGDEDVDGHYMDFAAIAKAKGA